MQVAEHEVATRVQETKDAHEAISPSTPIRQVTFNWLMPNGEGVDKVYTQAELGMFPAQEFAVMMTDVIDSFVQGEMGVKIGELFRGDMQLPKDFNPDTVNDVVEDNIEIIKAVVKLVQMMPDLQMDILCLSLGVPRFERDWAKTQMQEPPHRGGLTVDDGFDLLQMFIVQNASLIREKFWGKANELVATFRLEVLQETPSEETDSTDPTEDDQLDSPGGTPSSTSSPVTPVSV